MACADALVAPRPIEPTIAKPAIESLLALAVILQLLCCLLRSSNEPNSLHGGSRFRQVPAKFLDRHFLVTVSPSGPARMSSSALSLRPPVGQVLPGSSNPRIHASTMTRKPPTSAAGDCSQAP